MNTFSRQNRNYINFFQEIVAGVKKGFTFALPITTRSWKMKSRKFLRETTAWNNQPLWATYRSPSSLKDWSQNIKQRISPVQIYLTEKKQSETFKINLLWRVWSWLRMNASGRLNTCKSYGIRGSNTLVRVAHGCVTRMQSTLNWGIAPRNRD